MPFVPVLGLPALTQERAECAKPICTIFLFAILFITYAVVFSSSCLRERKPRLPGPPFHWVTVASLKRLRRLLHCPQGSQCVTPRILAAMVYHYNQFQVLIVALVIDTCALPADLPPIWQRNKGIIHQFIGWMRTTMAHVSKRATETYKLCNYLVRTYDRYLSQTISIRRYLHGYIRQDKRANTTIRGN